MSVKELLLLVFSGETGETRFFYPDALKFTLNRGLRSELSSLFCDLN